MYKHFLSKLEIVKLFGYDKYNKIIIKDMERENESENGVVFFFKKNLRIKL